MKNRIISTVCAFLFITGFSVAEAGFINDGIIKMKDLNLSVIGTLENNGTLVGTESAKIACETLTGKGLIQSPRLTIRADVFNFRGKIFCEEECIILTPVLIDENIFTFEGGGKLEFVIDPRISPDYNDGVEQDFCPVEDVPEVLTEFIFQ